jgi:demethylmenaquinone methyltransferase/2-methoxy-6-polyprenyl-1,4-benzoquinol methylase
MDVSGWYKMPYSKQDGIGHMFDQIAPTYDSVNHLLSFGQDLYWRKQIARLLPKLSSITLLDVATGTADLLIALCNHCPHIIKALGIDISERMLAFGREKLADNDLLDRAELIKADAQALPFGEQSFDVVTIAFGIRNVVHQEEALKEMNRVLKIGGTLFILEFSLPSNWFLKMIYLGYFRYVLPLVGGLISRNFAAYRYLNRSVLKFPSVPSFCQILRDCGFTSVAQKSLSFGVATIYCARKF